MQYYRKHFDLIAMEENFSILQNGMGAGGRG